MRTRPSNSQPSQLPKATEGLGPGTAVRLQGLQKAPELNGELGTLKSWDAASGRWLLRLASSSEKRLKLENLEVKALLRDGAPVRLRDLDTQELNGKTGVCRAWDEPKMRWKVAVDGHGEILLRATNLEECTSSPGCRCSSAACRAGS
ncbi:unnamed protein product [Effrenium voratum]|nr:unnamed protein product [Effrenium voratum]